MNLGIMIRQGSRTRPHAVPPGNTTCAGGACFKGSHETRVSGKIEQQWRSVLVEPVLAAFRKHLGLLRYLLRGLDNVRADWRMLCITHGLRKLMRRKRPVPDHFRDLHEPILVRLCVVMYTCWCRTAVDPGANERPPRTTRRAEKPGHCPTARRSPAAAADPEPTVAPRATAAPSSPQGSWGPAPGGRAESAHA